MYTLTIACSTAQDLDNVVTALKAAKDAHLPAAAKPAESLFDAPTVGAGDPEALLHSAEQPEVGAAPPPDEKPFLDGEGLPWDARIHSSGKTRYATPPHVWKLKRRPSTMGEPEWAAYLEEVKTELRKLVALSADTVASASATPDTTLAPPPPAVDAPAPTATLAPPPPQPAAAAGAPRQWDFPQLLVAITEAGLNAEADALCKTLGLAGFAVMGTRPDLYPAIAAQLGLS